MCLAAVLRVASSTSAQVEAANDQQTSPSARERALRARVGWSALPESHRSEEKAVGWGPIWQRSALPPPRLGRHRFCGAEFQTRSASTRRRLAASNGLESM